MEQNLTQASTALHDTSEKHFTKLTPSNLMRGEGLGKYEVLCADLDISCNFHQIICQ